MRISLDELLANDTWVRALAMRLVGDEHVAEDLVHETWIAALGTSGSSPSHPRAWLRGVVRNLARRHHRERERRRVHEPRAARAEALPSVAAMSEREAARQRVVHAVFALDEPYRSAILHRYFADLPPRAIAARLDVPVSTIEKRLSRGLSTLRARLGREFGGEGDRDRALCAIAAPVATTILSRAPTGVLLMGIKTKIAVATVAVVAATVLLWPKSPDAPLPLNPEPAAERHETTPEALPAGAPTSAPAAPVASRRALEPAAASPVSIASGPGAIAGVVLGSDGVALANARVRALAFEPLAVDLDPLAETRTDASGRYRLQPLAARCVVEASADGHGRDRRFATPHTRVDFALDRAASVQGTVLRAEGRTPVAGARIALYRWRPTDAFDFHYHYTGSRTPLASGRTDTEGRFRFEGVAPGTLRLRVVPTNGPETHSDAIPVAPGSIAEREVLLAPSIRLVGRTTDAATGAPVAGATITAGRHHRTTSATDGTFAIEAFERNPFDPRIAPVVTAPGYYPKRIGLGWNYFETERVVDAKLRPAALVRGRVVGPDGPIAGARIAPSFRVTHASDTIPIGWTSDESGAFAVPVPVGSDRPTHLYATAPGLGWTRSPALAVTAGETLDGVEVRFARGATVAGRVRTTDGEPAVGARVSIWSPHERSAQFFVRRISVETHAGGHYAISGVPDGQYEVRVVPPGVLDGDASPWRGAVHAPVVVANGSAPRVDVALDRGPVIVGRVVDSDGRPIAGALVRASVVAPGRRHDPTTPCDRIAHTGDGGQFRVEGLFSVEQPYFVRVFKRGYHDHIERDLLPSGEAVAITLDALRAIPGRVVDATTGEPVAAFCIATRLLPDAEGDKPRWSQSARAGGHFRTLDGRFTLRLSPGAYSIAATAIDGRRSDAIRLDVRETGAAPSLAFRVATGAAVRGEVRPPEGELRHARIEIYARRAAGLGRVKEVSLGLDGGFLASGLGDGEHVLYANAVDDEGRRLVATARVALRVGTVADVKLDVDPPATARVLVLGADGRPCPNATVTLARADAAPFAMDLTRSAAILEWTREARRAGKAMSHADALAARRRALERLTSTGPDGRLLPLVLLPGDYTIAVTAPDHRPHRSTLAVAPGSEQAVRIRLEADPTRSQSATK